MVSVLFHSPARGSFHLSLTVLVHYRSLLVFSLTSWSTQIPAGFHVSRGTQVPIKSLSGFAYEVFTLCDKSIPDSSATKKKLFIIKDRRALQPPTCAGFGLFPFRSPLLRESHIAFFSSPYLDVSVQGVPAQLPMYSVAGSPVNRGRLPHSEISGSKLVVSSPKLIADYYVLHRPREPRHPPNALI